MTTTRPLEDNPPPPTESDAPPEPHRNGARNGTTPIVRPRDRIQPHDLDAERAVISACLYADPQTVDQAAHLDPAAFYNVRHQRIWQAVLDLHGQGVAADPALVTTDDPDDRALVFELGGNQLAYRSNIAVYAARITTTAHQRALLRVAAELADAAYQSDQIDLTALLAKVERPTTTETDPWAPQSLADAWDQPILEQPHVLRRDDGIPLLYMGRINTVAGPPESGKSWLAYIAAAQLAQNETHCAYIDLEDRAAGAASRLRNLGVTRDQADQYVHYFAPDTDLRGAEHAMRKLGVPIDLIIVDSASEAIVASGGEINSNDDGTRFGRALRQLATTTGAAIFYIDHVSNAHDPGSGKSLGASAKRRFLDGAAYETLVVHRFGPGRGGAANILNTKDRHGGAIAHCARKGKHDLAGQLHITSTSTGTIETWGIKPPDEMPADTTQNGDFRPTGYMERISRTLELKPEGAGTKELRTSIGGRAGIVDAAIRALIEEGHVTVTPGPRGARIHTITVPFRENPEPPPPTDDNEPF